MLVWWQYTITFVGSLTVALASVWVAQRWATNREYKKALQNLRSEVLVNIRAAKLICEWVDTNIESLKNGQIVVASCPRFYDSVWVAVRGAITVKDYPNIASLEDAYLMVVVVNDLLRTIDGLKWEIGGSLPNIGKRISLILDATKHIVNDTLLPMLENGKSILDEKLQ